MTDDGGNPSAWQSVRLKHPHAADERGKSVGTDCVGGFGRGGGRVIGGFLHRLLSLFFWLFYFCGNKTYCFLLRLFAHACIFPCL